MHLFKLTYIMRVFIYSAAFPFVFLFFTPAESLRASNYHINSQQDAFARS